MDDRDKAEQARIAAIAYLVFQRGGIAGAVRQIVYGWRGRFSAAQINIALRRRWPILVPPKHQVEDCLNYLEKQRVIKCVIHKHSKLYIRIKKREANYLQFQRPFRLTGRGRDKNLNHSSVRENNATKQRRPVEVVQGPADAALSADQAGYLPGLFADPDHRSGHHAERSPVGQSRTVSIGGR